MSSLLVHINLYQEKRQEVPEKNIHYLRTEHYR
jgi:hypothetical protein